MSAIIAQALIAGASGGIACGPTLGALAWLAVRPGKKGKGRRIP